MALEEIRKSSTFKRALELNQNDDDDDDVEEDQKENDEEDENEMEQLKSDQKQPIQKMRRIDPTSFYREMPNSFDWVKKLASLKKPISTKSTSSSEKENDEEKKIEIFSQLKNAFEFVDK